MLADFPDTITVGDVATRHGVLFGVTSSATRPARDTIIGTCRGYVAWADGVPVDSFDLYVHDGQIEAWKSDTFSPDRRAIRAAAALALNARANCDVRLDGLAADVVPPTATTLLVEGVLEVVT